MDTSSEELISVVIDDNGNQDQTVATHRAEDQSSSSSSASASASDSHGRELLGKEKVDNATVVSELDKAIIDKICSVVGVYSETLSEEVSYKYEQHKKRTKILVLVMIFFIIVFSVGGISLAMLFLINYSVSLVAAGLGLFFSLYWMHFYTWMTLNIRIYYLRKVLEKDFSDICNLATFADTLLNDPARANHWSYLQYALSHCRRAKLGANDSFLDPSIRKKDDYYTRICRLIKLPNVIHTRNQLMIYFRKGVIPENVRDHREWTKNYPRDKQALLYLLSHNAIHQDFEKPFDAIEEGELNSWIEMALKLY